MTDDKEHEHRAEDRAHLARMHMVNFETFYKYYIVRLVRFLTSQANNSDWAEEVAQDTMIAIWDKWDEALTYERPDSWLFRVATRKLRRLESRARKNGRLHEDLASSGCDLLAAAGRDNWIEDNIDLMSGMRALPRRQCEVIGLHYFGGYTIPEAAEILGIKENTAKTHLKRGLENLRQYQEMPSDLKLNRRITV